jgi:hypothetical protein
MARQTRSACRIVARRVRQPDNRTFVSAISGGGKSEQNGKHAD